MTHVRRAALVVGLVAVSAACSSGIDTPPNLVATRTCDGPSNASPVMPDGLAAYDADGGYLIVVSQRSGVDSPGDFGTWKWSCTWSRLTGPDQAPAGYAMAYDAALHMTILVGQKTMAWDGSQWLDMHATPPFNRGDTTLVYDAARSVLVLVDSFGPAAETWTYDGHAWRKVASAGPATQAGAAYDPRSRKIVLFAPSPAGAVDRRAFTWTWDGTSWSWLNASTDPEADGGTMAYDEATSQMILVTRSGDTWSWDGSAWTQLGVRGPANIGSNGLVYDAAGRQLILWQTWKYWDRSQTWTYNGVWTQLP
jgi:hypothetical protein